MPLSSWWDLYELALVRCPNCKQATHPLDQWPEEDWGTDYCDVCSENSRICPNCGESFGHVFPEALLEANSENTTKDSPESSG